MESGCPSLSLFVQFFVVVSGEVRVFREAGSGDEQEPAKDYQELNRLGPGSSFGSRALLTGWCDLV